MGERVVSGHYQLQVEARGELLVSADDGPGAASSPTSDQLFGYQWHLRNTGQTGGRAGIDLNVVPVWQDYRGDGVKVGVIDDGFEHTHPDFDNYDTSLDYDVRSGDTDAFASESGDRHGTATAGVIAADDDGSGAVGVAPDATLVGYRMGYGSAGSTYQVVNALSRQVDVDISSNSWSYTTAFDDNFQLPYLQSMATALYTGVVNGRDGLGTNFVFSAGNARTSGDNVNHHNIQNSPYTIAVGAIDAYGNSASFSTPGEAVLVSAPGVSVFTTDRVNGGYSSGDHVSVSGTSFSAPAVAGVVALMLDANPELGYRDVQEILAYSAWNTDTAAAWRINGADTFNGGGLHFHARYGFGLVDAHAAVRLAETWTRQSTFIANPPAAQSSPGFAIPDNSVSGVTDSLVFATDWLIDRVTVDLEIAHQRIGDLIVTLRSPSGTLSDLIYRPGVNPDSMSGYGSTLQNLDFVTTSNAFWGETSGGEWSLIVSDRASGSTGTLNRWTMKVYGDPVTTDDVFIYTKEYATLAGSSREVLTDDDGGIDTINAAAVPGDISINLNIGAAGSIMGRPFSVDSTIEHVYAGDGDDVLVGQSAANMLFGGRGDDQLFGGDGNDTLEGSAGNDILDGGSGIDIAVYEGAFAAYTVAVDAGTGAVTITDAFDAFGEGTDTLTGIEVLRFSDGDRAAPAGHANQRPVANADSASTAEDTARVVAVLANDWDADGDALSIASAGGAAHGNVAINGNGTVTYTPNANYFGTDSFTYTIRDSGGLVSNTATVSVTVTPVNDRPVANADSASTAQDTAVDVAVLANDSDADGDALSIASAGGAAHGSVAINGNGTVTYTPNADYFGTDSFTYTVRDNGGLVSAPATVTVTVTPVNDEAAPPSSRVLADAVLWLDAADKSTLLDGDGDSLLTGTGGAGNGFGGGVRTWVDKSHQGNNAVQTAPSARSTVVVDDAEHNGLTVLQFDGVDDEFLVTEHIDNTDTTIFAVIGETAGFSGWRTFYTDNDFLLLSRSASTDHWGSYDGNSQELTSTSLSDTTKLITFTGTNNGQTGAFRTNGVADGQYVSGFSNKKPQTVIGDNAGAQQNHPGFIAELIVFDRVLNADEIADVEDYLSDKWLPQTPPPPPTPLPLPVRDGVILWLDAADKSTLLDGDGDSLLTGTGGAGNGFGGGVRTWVDKSHQGNNAVQTAPSARSTVVVDDAEHNGLTVLQFDGVDDEFLVTEHIDNTDTTIFAVIGETAGFSGWRTFYTDNDFLLLSRSASTDRWGSYDGNSQELTSTSLSDTTKLITFTGTNNGQTGAFRTNGVADGQYVSGFSNKKPQTVIGDNAGAQQNHPGFIAELIVFDRVLNADEIADVEDYLSDKWFENGSAGDETATLAADIADDGALVTEPESLGSLLSDDWPL